MAAGYRWYVGDRRTGRIWRQIDLVGATWSINVETVAGTMDGGSFPLRSGEWPTFGSDTTPGKAFLAVSYVDDNDDETFIEAGPATPGRYTDGTGMQAVAGAGALAAYARRKAIEPLSPGENPAISSVTYDANELGLIAKRLFELAHSHVGGEMPIVLPSDADLGGAGTAHTRTYKGHELPWVAQALANLSTVADGVEIQLVPRKAADIRYIEWVARIGVADSTFPNMLTQDGPAIVLDQTVDGSSVLSIDVDIDASKVTSRSFASGSGDAEGKLIGWAEDLTLVEDAGFALTESEISASDQTLDIDTLTAHAAGDVAAHRAPVEIWTVTLERDGNPNAGQLRPGYWVRLTVGDHARIPAGTYLRRIVGMRGGGPSTIEVQLAESAAVI